MRRTDVARWVRGHLPSEPYRKLWLTVVVLRALVLAPSVLAEDTAPESTPPAVVKPQKLILEEVRIEGKLYSPQALFIVSRAPESFGRDTVVPHVLRPDVQARLFPFRLNDAMLEAKRDVVRGEAAMPLHSNSPPRRSP